MGATFDINTTSDPNMYIGLHFTYDQANKLVFIDHDGYIQKNIRYYIFDDANPIAIPIDFRSHMVSFSNTKVFLMRFFPYKQLVLPTFLILPRWLLGQTYLLL
jgi:hypothetical protein